MALRLGDWCRDLPDALSVVLSPMPLRELTVRRVTPIARAQPRLRYCSRLRSSRVRGVSLVNGMFKGISTDALWPDDGLFFGRIRLPRQVIESDEEIDLLGIRYVLANPGESVAGSRPVPSDRASLVWPCLRAWQRSSSTIVRRSSLPRTSRGGRRSSAGSRRC